MRVLELIIHRKAWWRGSLIAVLIAAGVGAAPELTIRAENAVVLRTDTSGTLGIYLTTTVDTVVAYQIWLQLDRPDIAQFKETFDTAGSLSSGWDLVHVHSVAGDGYDAMVVGLANDITVPGSGQSILPSETERLLVRLPFTVQAVPDTMTDLTALVRFSTQANYLNFSRPNGTTIGLTLAEIADTACLHCMQWFGNDCLQWQLASGPPCDTLIITLDTIPMLDSLKLVSIPGSITICNRTVYDIDINGDGLTMTVGDLVELIRFVSGDTNAVADFRDADVNGDCRIDWGDYILLDSLYHLPGIPEYWPPLPCPCDNPVRVCCWQMRGNLDGDLKQLVDLTDLSTLVAYLTGFGPIVLKCTDEANVDGLGIVDLSDLSLLVAYLVGTGAPPLQCP